MTTNNIRNYRMRAILLTFLCCLVLGRWAVFYLPFGIVTIVYGTEVKTRLELTDELGATTASKKAKKWFWFGLIVAIIIMALYGYYKYNIMADNNYYYD
ncbi:MAG: CD225/dispanin family protein [Okeania sp. SIO2C2]|uniref:CD225/dispanin family protein n=1 Tax=Okeania sp. SIO2C2 TaxID=2607787 RepID=UPI0013BC3909|nr:CD225/dispanin family protein [Okeania sp. SIO2C2]NEP88254.1 CD225/dispanin family protein [Okeania sp. SIO2C2]